METTEVTSSTENTITSDDNTTVLMSQEDPNSCADNSTDNSTNMRTFVNSSHSLPSVINQTPSFILSTNSTLTPFKASTPLPGTVAPDGFDALRMETTAEFNERKTREKQHSLAEPPKKKIRVEHESRTITQEDSEDHSNEEFIDTDIAQYSLGVRPRKYFTDEIKMRYARGALWLAPLLQPKNTALTPQIDSDNTGELGSMPTRTASKENSYKTPDNSRSNNSVNLKSAISYSIAGTVDIVNNYQNTNMWTDGKIDNLGTIDLDSPLKTTVRSKCSNHIADFEDDKDFVANATRGNLVNSSENSDSGVPAATNNSASRSLSRNSQIMSIDGGSDCVGVDDMVDSWSMKSSNRSPVHHYLADSGDDVDFELSVSREIFSDLDSDEGPAAVNNTTSSIFGRNSQIMSIDGGSDCVGVDGSESTLKTTKSSKSNQSFADFDDDVDSELNVSRGIFSDQDSDDGNSTTIHGLRRSDRLMGKTGSEYPKCFICRET